MTGIITKSMSWQEIEALYRATKRANVEAEKHRAKMLMQMRDTTPWRDRSRYGSVTVYTKYAKFSWREIVVDVLHEDFTEVENTVCMLRQYGEEKHSSSRAALPPCLALCAPRG